MSFRLDTYLQRIGYAGPRDATVEVLGELARLHPQAIAFENIDAFTGRRPSLELADVHGKLVRDGRGGWCFEHNLLLGEALRAFGFEVTDLAARVLWNRPADALTPRTHRLLAVRAAGRHWLVDAGFGGHTLTGVLDLDSGASQATPHEPFRLQRQGAGEFRLESLIAGQWVNLYRFDLQPQLAVDFEAANFQLAHDPASHFTQTLIVSRTGPGCRSVLRGMQLSIYKKEGGVERRELGRVEEVLETLGGHFGLPVEALAALPGRIAQLLGT